VNWYPKRDVQWYPDKPTVAQVAFGAVLFLAVAGLLLYWTVGESNTGNRIFLFVMAGFALVLATWRIAVGFQLFREARRRRRAVRGL